MPCANSTPECRRQRARSAAKFERDYIEETDHAVSPSRAFAGPVPSALRHAIYVRKIADQAFEAVDTVPEVLASRLLAVRAFDAQHMMIDAKVCEGAQAAEMFDRFLANPQTSYLQVHNARRGCYAARVERA